MLVGLKKCNRAGHHGSIVSRHIAVLYVSYVRVPCYTANIKLGRSKPEVIGYLLRLKEKHLKLMEIKIP